MVMKVLTKDSCQLDCWVSRTSLICNENPNETHKMWIMERARKHKKASG